MPTLTTRDGPLVLGSFRTATASAQRYVLPTLGTLGQLIRRGAQLPYIECNPRKNTVASESRQYPSRRYMSAKVEAGTGIEPVYTDLQSAASPLRQPAKNQHR